MLQIFFISILINLLGGILLILLSRNIENSFFKNIKNFFSNKIVESLLGLAIVLTGILKFFIPARPNGIIIFADFLPAIVGIIVGIIILINVFSKEGIGDDKINQVDAHIKPGYLLIGSGTIAITILHFLFPGVVLL